MKAQKKRNFGSVVEIAGAQLVENSFPGVLENKTNIGMDLVVLAPSLLDFLKCPRALAVFAEPYLD